MFLSITHYLFRDRNRPGRSKPQPREQRLAAAALVSKWPGAKGLGSAQVPSFGDINFVPADPVGRSAHASDAVTQRLATAQHPSERLPSVPSETMLDVKTSPTTSAIETATRARFTRLRSPESARAKASERARESAPRRARNGNTIRREIY